MQNPKIYIQTFLQLMSKLKSWISWFSWRKIHVFNSWHLSTLLIFTKCALSFEVFKTNVSNESIKQWKFSSSITVICFQSARSCGIQNNGPQIFQIRIWSDPIIMSFFQFQIITLLRIQECNPAIIRYLRSNQYPMRF